MPEINDSNTIDWTLDNGTLKASSSPAVAVYTRNEDLIFDAVDTWQAVPMLTVQESPNGSFTLDNGAVVSGVSGFVFVSAKLRFEFTGSGNPTIRARIRATLNDEIVPWLIDSGTRERGTDEVTSLDFAHPVEMQNGDVLKLEAQVNNTDLILAACPGTEGACAGRLSLHAISEAP